MIRRRRGQPRPPDALEALAAGVQFAPMAAVAAQATAMGVPTDRLDDLWQRMQSEQIPDTPAALVATISRIADGMGIDLSASR